MVLDWLPENLTIAGLYKEHDSKLRNPLLAQVFYCAGFIDILGKRHIEHSPATARK